MDLQKLDFILNDILNKALISKDRIQQPNSNNIADFVSKYISDKTVQDNYKPKKKIMSNSKVEHTTIRNEKLFCLNCGGQHPLKIPIATKEMTDKIDAFNVLHKDCRKTWAEPIADINGKTLEENKNWWLLHGEHGISSKNMFAVLSGGYRKSDGKLMTPSDPSDFYRCSKLLQAVPQWKADLHKLKQVSETWEKLVDNWDKLETMLIEAKVLWSKGIGASEMYDFMKKLGC